MEKEAKKATKRPVVYSMKNDQCVWGRAGVIKPVKCINAFDCLGCAMDQRVLSGFDKKRKQAGKFDKRPARMLMLMNQGKCRHMLSGRISYGLCSYGYNCLKCPFDQMIEDTSYMPNIPPPGLDTASGFNVARDHYYHFGHTWVRVEYGGRVRIGLDDFVLKLFGPQDGIRIPGLGFAVKQNHPLVVLKRKGNEAPTLSPMDGKVVAVNPKIGNHPDLPNQDPYGEGWLMVIQPATLRNNLKNLFFGDESLAWIDDEFMRLQQIMNEVMEDETQYKMAATGGEAISDIYGEMPDIGWDRLVKEFLRT